MVCTKLVASGGAAAVVGLVLYYLNMQKPLWRAALVVFLAALAAYFGYSYQRNVRSASKKSLQKDLRHKNVAVSGSSSGSHCTFGHPQENFSSKEK